MGLYHQILGVPEDAGLDLVKSSYRALCKKYHPDLNDEEAIGKMALINEAYGALARGEPGRRPQGSTRPLDPRGTASAERGVAPRANQDYLFYKQGFQHFRACDDNLAFRDSNEWNGETRRFDKRDALEGYERNLYKALYYFNLVCSEYPESDWRADALQKIKLLNQKRSFLASWKSRFGT